VVSLPKSEEDCKFKGLIARGKKVRTLWGKSAIGSGKVRFSEACLLSRRWGRRLLLWSGDRPERGAQREGVVVGGNIYERGKRLGV